MRFERNCWGKLHAVHLEPDGASYKAVREEFLSGAPLPLTDAIVHPGDGAIYFAIGGRRVQSGVYRVTYTGSESTAPVRATSKPSPVRALRHSLEAWHGKSDPAAIPAAWPHLGSPHRFIRWAARTALEHVPIRHWADRALTEKDPSQRIEALLGLARAGGISPPHRQPGNAPVDTNLEVRLLDSLAEIDWAVLDDERRGTLVRTAQIVLHRFDPLPAPALDRLRAKLDLRFAAPSADLNWLLCETLVFLRSPTVAAKAVRLIAAAPTQEEQIEYARSLRRLDTGWTLATRTAQFEWFLKATNFRGGMSFSKFIEFIRSDALATLTAEERTAPAPLLERKAESRSPIENLGDVFASRTPTNWTLEQLSTAAARGMKGRDFDNGRKMFGAGACFACHRFGNEGGVKSYLGDGRWRDETQPPGPRGAKPHRRSISWRVSPRTEPVSRFSAPERRNRGTSVCTVAAPATIPPPARACTSHRSPA